ncbi:E3 ubiquitin-protein ligase ZNF598-like [Paramacrobiotus metropolitanus]|uniref:E3 ubiquitin-protein ligase ZNF598-like n=1 Tax=Paramacrobiotus metropolitanus TaxID=2943436 RepID=UPI00244645D7|nr:E3 ubiquitin-protein ligase ZNF598-like [Paramacrobiotus metropolitanus]XP_055327312.1 E3 ubiquitin-protein ligase ZNF598-like [Paramacrobiotus metropolitanus]XP_055327313.1 E3 ubiquitin-protein ligase ZNF598-like [Paramacrobiotus metropolitanus]
MDYHNNSGSYEGRPQHNRLQPRNRSRPSEGGERGKNTCPICFSDLTDIIALQPCSHVLCFECAVRNRVLCNKKECPVCRAACAEVVLAGHRPSDVNESDRFESILSVARRQGKSDPYYGFLFENIGIERAYRKMLTHACRFCDRPFEEFDQLVKHVRDRHDHHYCNVCVRQLMLFTWEHKLYMYDELLRHLEEGDPTDKTIPPHPQCQLCSFRAFDKDELYRHSKQRHHLCWICEMDSNKVLFFKDFYDLFEHMVDHHHVCKICSKPDEAQVKSFSTKEALEIHTAADHGGGLDPRMFFNFEHHPRAERGARGERRRREQEQEVENRPVTPPPPPNFNMEPAHFPALGLDAVGSGGGDVSVAPKEETKKSGPSVQSGESVRPVPKYGAPKLTEGDFPVLSGHGPAPSKIPAGPSWASNAKVTAVPKSGSSSSAKLPKKSVPLARPNFTDDSFPELDTPAPIATKKLNQEWVSVPVKSKGQPKEPKTTQAKPAASRWDLPEEPTSPPSNRKTIESPLSYARPNGINTDAVSKPTVVRNLYYTDSKGAQNLGADAFPTLSAPAKNVLPGMFGGTPKKKSEAKAKIGKVAVVEKNVNPINPSGNSKKSEEEQIAESLFKSARSFSRGSSENGVETEEDAIVPSPVAAIIHHAPYKMKKDDFPTLEGKAPKQKVHVPDDIAMPDRVRKQKEVKTQWGNTMVQYETVYTFVPPSNARERTDALRAKVEPVEVKGKSKTLDDFQHELIAEQLSPLEFWMECQRILGKKFPQLMPEVLALLPNLSLQEEIYEVAKVPIYGNQQVVKALALCKVCRQVVKTVEKDEHEKVHKGAH